MEKLSSLFKIGLMMRLTLVTALSLLSLLSYSQDSTDTRISKRINDKLVQAVKCQERLLTQDSTINNLNYDVTALEIKLDAQADAFKAIELKHDACQIESNHFLDEIVALQEDNSSLKGKLLKWRIGGIAAAVIAVFLVF